MFRVVFFLLPKFGFIAIIICATGSNDGLAHTHYSSIAKCSKLEFAKPESPELSKCPECTVDSKGVLTCKCYTDEPENLELKESSLAIYSCPRNYAYPRCAEDIRVVDGKLSCRKISEESTFQKQCWSCSLKGSILKCDCWQQHREHMTSELDLTNCYGPVSNCNGVLTCGLCETQQSQDIAWIAPVLFSVGISIPFIIAVRYAWIKLVRR